MLTCASCVSAALRSDCSRCSAFCNSAVEGRRWWLWLWLLLCEEEEGREEVVDEFELEGWVLGLELGLGPAATERRWEWRREAKADRRLWWWPWLLLLLLGDVGDEGGEEEEMEEEMEVLLLFLVEEEEALWDACACACACACWARRLDSSDS